MKKRLLSKINSDNGFMGPTHAMSGVAVFLFVAAFFPMFIQKLFGQTNVFIYTAALLIVVGSALLPDFDNVKSTAISVLGIVGQGISSAMRGSARAIYSITRSKYDKPNADPHRGFWHTIVAGLSIGGLTYLLLKSTSMIKITLSGKDFSLATIIVGFIILISTQLVFAVFFKKVIRKMSNGILGRLTSWILGFAVAISLVINFPPNSDFKWVGIAISAGWITHILGDTLTTSGTPLFFPIPHKGHRWWSHRWYPRIKANGPVEHYIFIPFFLIIIAISVSKLILG